MDRTRQVVFCSEDIGRASLVTIVYSHTHGVVEHCEALPPGYDRALLNMRDPQEDVLVLQNLRMDERNRRCPFCGNRQIFYCDACGAISCINGDRKIHACPCCPCVCETEPVFYEITSPSGLLGSPAPRRTLPPRPRISAPPQRATASDWQRAIERQRKIQTQAGPARQQPALPAPRKSRVIAGLLPWRKEEK